MKFVFHNLGEHHSAGWSKTSPFPDTTDGLLLWKGNGCHCMACSLTGMSGAALMLLPHKQLSSASSSTASWVTSYFENSPSFLPHSFWMEVFARGFPALVSSFLHSSAFSVVPAQLLSLKSGSLKYQQKRKVFYSLFWFCFVLTQTRIEICFPVPAQLVEQCSAAEEQ